MTDNQHLPPTIFIMGPTASGKTNVAVELVQHYPIELISVDSALVFRDMNIGTAKPDAETLARAPHHLIDIVSPTEAYSAASFMRDALRLMNEITAKGKIPVLVGGTMLYFKALREGLSPLPQADASLRAKLDNEIATHGIAHLHRQLAEIDPITATRLHATDTQRIQRALEIYLLTGKAMSELIKEQPEYQLPYNVLRLALLPSDRAVLHQRIAVRFANMLKEGLVEELKELRKKYVLDANMTSMRCVGYRQAWEFIEGEIDAQQLLEKGIAATRQLAKRQLTWLRSTPEIETLDCLSNDLYPQAAQLIQQHLNRR